MRVLVSVVLARGSGHYGPLPRHQIRKDTVTQEISRLTAGLNGFCVRYLRREVDRIVDKWTTMEPASCVDGPRQVPLFVACEWMLSLALGCPKLDVKGAITAVTAKRRCPILRTIDTERLTTIPRQRRGDGFLSVKLTVSPLHPILPQRTWKSFLVVLIQ